MVPAPRTATDRMAGLRGSELLLKGLRFGRQAARVKELHPVDGRARDQPGGGEIMMMLSPLTMRVPRELDLPSATISSAFSRDRFMCWSKPCSEPRITLPPFSLIRTTFPRLVSSTFIAMSADIVSDCTG